CLTRESEERLHPGHRSIRLRGYDYAARGFYFVTVCTHETRCTLARVVGGKVQLTALGEMARGCWAAIPRRFPTAPLAALVVQPNHLHGIVELVAKLGHSSAAPLREAQPRVAAGSLGAIVRSVKAAVRRRARPELNWRDEVWQRNYFERVLRDGQDLVD